MIGTKLLIFPQTSSVYIDIWQIACRIVAVCTLARWIQPISATPL
jgi:hypothetical protein